MRSHTKLRDKLIFATIVIVILGNFIFSKPIKANVLTDFGGTLLDSLSTFSLAIADVVLNALQTNLYIDQKVVIDANSPKAGYWDWGSWLTYAGGVLAIVGGILLSPITGGTSLMGTGAGITLIIGGTVAAVSGAIDTTTKLVGNYELPMIFYTPYAIFSNSIPLFDINFFSPNIEKENEFVIFTTGEVEKGFAIQSQSSARVLQPYISGWYYSLRNLAIVAMLTILVYIGIRMLITSVSKDKAKYKQMLMDWFVAMCLIITMHYIMIFIVNITEKICDMFSGMTVENVLVPLPAGTTYKFDGTEYAIENDPNAGGPIWATNFVGNARLIAGGTKAEGGDPWLSVEYTIIYLVLVIYIVIFTVIYLKRVLYMAFLTIIAPLVAMTYPLDKLHDGQAQGFNKWLKEYIFNALLAPVHMMLYAILMGSAMHLVTNYPIYAIVALGFMISAEKILRNLFGFQKAETAGNMGAIGLAGTGMLMSGLNRLMRRNRYNSDKEKEDNYENVRFNSRYDNMLNSSTDDGNTQNTPQINENNGQETPPMPTNGGSDGQQAQENSPQPNGNDDGYRTHWSDYGVDPSNLGPNGEMIIQGTHGFESNRSINSNSQITQKRSIKNGLANVASMGWHRFKRSNPGGKALRGLAYGAGAGTLGMIGLAAGIASGDLGKTASYTGVAAHVGGSLGAGIAGKVSSSGGRIMESFRQGYYGTEYDEKVLEEAIKHWQTDPSNIQYLRAREANYKEIIKNIYPEYAKYGCNGIQDFYAAYQLEKSGRSRSQAISTYKLAKRTR